MTNKDTARIVGLLDSGPFWGESFKKILICYLVLVLFCLMVMCVGIVLLTIEQIENPDSIVLFVAMLIFWVIVTLALPLVMLVLIIKNEKKRKQVFLWLDDAVLLKAKSKAIGRKYQLGLFPCVKIQLNFELDGIHYSRESESVSDKTVKEGGYYYIWSKYANRDIDILFSPKYNQIMVLNDKK